MSMQSQYLKLDTTSLAVLDVCPYESGYIITRINVPVRHRGKGIGSTLLKRCCKLADEQGVDLYLEVFPSGNLNGNQLNQWYKRYGFRDRGGILKRVSMKSKD